MAVEDMDRGGGATGSEEHTFVDGTLSIVGQGLSTLGPEWAKRYGGRTTRLDLSFNDLASLHNIEGFTKLTGLVLDNNDIETLAGLPKLRSLTELSLNKNKLDDLGHVMEQISKCTGRLRYLSLLGNQACPNELVAKDNDDYKKYRHAVLYDVPTLKFLDSTPVTAAEVAEAKRIGQFCKVVRPKFDDDNDEDENARESSYTPLPDTIPSKQKGTVAVGVYRERFSNSQSEGNRFILNNEL